ncbi:hypothetical protein STBA_26200 [Streptomyces sp. MP131-18]|nr:hypothetical protein STBA_26200 [Streptomyces sp. MP131-18]
MAAVAAVVVTGGAAVLGLVHWILGLAADRQEMSLGGVSPTAIRAGAWSAGAALAAYLLLCGALLARTAIRDVAPHRVARAALAAAAVLHAVLGALAVGLVGWAAFAVLIVVFGLIMLTLTLYPPPEDAGPAAGSGPQVGDGDPDPGEQGAQQGQGQPDDGPGVAVDPVDERGRPAVEGERPGDAQRFA